MAQKIAEPRQLIIQDSRFKSIYLIIYRHQSYKLTEQCENKSNISWWVSVWRPSLRPNGRYDKGHRRMFVSARRIMVSKYDNNKNNNNTNNNNNKISGHRPRLVNEHTPKRSIFFSVAIVMLLCLANMHQRRVARTRARPSRKSGKRKSKHDMVRGMALNQPFTCMMLSHCNYISMA